MDDLRRRMQGLSAERTRDLDEARQLLSEQMAQREQRDTVFDGVAANITSDILQPRLELLASQFSDAVLEMAPGHVIRVRFNTARLFQASVLLEFKLQLHTAGPVSPGVNLGGAGEPRGFLFYRLEILPILMPYEGHDELALRRAGPRSR